MHSFIVGMQKTVQADGDLHKLKSGSKTMKDLETDSMGLTPYELCDCSRVIETFISSSIKWT